MKKKNHILLFIVVTFALQAYGQSYTRLNNFWDNLYSINPAAVNYDRFGTATASTRLQSVHFPGAPASYMGTGTIYLDKLYTQFGAKVVTEKKGYTQKLETSLSYAYRVMLNNDWFMNLGVSASYQNLSYDISQIVLPDYETPDFYNNFLTSNYMNAGVGIQFDYNNIKIGASSSNIISTFDSENELYPFTNIVYGMYRQRNSNFINWGFGAAGFQYSNIYQGEFNTTAYFKKTMENQEFQVGLLYRTWKEIGFTFGMDFDWFMFRYSYDYNLGQSFKYSYGSHELMLIYKFDRKYKCVNCDWY